MVYQSGRVDSTKFSDGLYLSDHGLQTLPTVLVEPFPTVQRSDNNWTEVTRGKKSKRKPDPKTRNQQNREPMQKNHDIRQQNNRHAQTRSDDTKGRELLKQKQNVPPVILQDAMIDNITGIIRTRKRYSGCWMRGLYNHKVNTCYYYSKLHCRECNEYGQKTKYCNSSQN